MIKWPGCGVGAVRRDSSVISRQALLIVQKKVLELVTPTREVRSRRYIPATPLDKYLL